MFKNYLTKLFAIACLAVFIFSGYSIIARSINLNQSKNENIEIKKLIQTSNTKNIETIKTNDKNNNSFNEKFNTLKELNEDYRFWITIPNSNIDYPVVQSNNNQYYLNKSFKNKNSISGSIFMDYRYNESSLNMVIYGHNMKNGSMFHDLRDYNKLNDKNKYINIETEDGLYIYEVFSSYVTSANFNYIQTNFNNKDEYMSFLNEIKNKSEISSDLELTVDDKILTLSTCSYEFENARRAVHAKLIEIKR